MKSDDYQAWKDAKAQVEVPKGFSDRVMETILSDDSSGNRSRPKVEKPLRSRPLVRYVLAGSCLLACLGLGALRIGSAIAIHLLMKSEAT